MPCNWLALLCSTLCNCRQLMVQHEVSLNVAVLAFTTIHVHISSRTRFGVLSLNLVLTANLKFLCWYRPASTCTIIVFCYESASRQLTLCQMLNGSAIFTAASVLQTSSHFTTCMEHWSCQSCIQTVGLESRDEAGGQVVIKACRALTRPWRAECPPVS